MKKQYIYGLHAVLSALRNDQENLRRIYYDNSRRDRRLGELVDLAESCSIDLQILDKKDLDKMSGGARHQSVIAQYEAAESGNESDLFDALSKKDKPWLILILDGVTDPHNLGACLRTADAAGVDALLVPKDRATGITPVVRKVSAGGADNVPFFQVTNLKRTLTKLQDLGVWIVGTSDQSEKNYLQIDYKGSTALVLGGEGKGMRRLTSEACDELVTLPMAGTVSSLNVSVACGICLYEVLRQRNNIN